MVALYCFTTDSGIWCGTLTGDPYKNPAIIEIMTTIRRHSTWNVASMSTRQCWPSLALINGRNASRTLNNICKLETLLVGLSFFQVVARNVLVRFLKECTMHVCVIREMSEGHS